MQDLLLDDLLGDIIPQHNNLDSPEDHFMHFFTEGKMPKIANLVYYLRVELTLYDRFVNNHMYIASLTHQGLKRVALDNVSRILIEHYLSHYHTAKFAPGMGYSVPNMQSVVTMLLDNDLVKKVIYTNNRS